MIRSIAVAAVIAALLSATTAQGADAVSPAIAAAVSDTGRPAADTARDANRHPAAVLAFAGVKPGMTVAELVPGGGYYTRILAKAVGPGGKLYALITPGAASQPRVLDTLNALAKEYPNVTVVTTDFADIKLPSKVDLFWTTENYHDFHNSPTLKIDQLNQSVFQSLKPGGIFYVEDHHAADGAGLEVTSTLHRMDLAIATQELTSAGFMIEAEGNVLRNPADDRSTSNSEAGHFVTDRFMLRLKRP